MDIFSLVDLPMIEKYNLKSEDIVLVKETGEENLVEIFEEIESLPKVNYVRGTAENTLRVLGMVFKYGKIRERKIENNNDRKFRR